MPIESRCHGCGKTLRVADEHAGKQARCPGCGYVYTVADVQPAVLAIAPLPVESPLSQPELPLTLWYMKTPEGQIYGPASRDQLNSWVSQGRVSSDCFLRQGERGPWQAASSLFPTLQAPRTRATATSTGGGYAARPQGTHVAQPTHASNYASANPYAMPRAFGSAAYVQPHRGGLVLAFALLGWFLCPIFAVVAWSMGNEDLNKIRRGQMDSSGLGLTQAGQILGMIVSILFLLGLGLMFVGCLVGAIADM